MINDSLKGRRILIVEDEYLLVFDLTDLLQDAGVEVVGPCGTLRDALSCAQQDSTLDAAILDVNLHGEMVFPVADRLMALDVPFVFATGYDEGAIPERFDGTVRLEKPVKPDRLSEALQLLKGA